MGVEPRMMVLSPSLYRGVDKSMEVSLMGRNQLKAVDVDGFVVAFHDEVRDTEEMYGVRISFDLRLRGERGSISLHAMAVRDAEDGPDHLVATADVRWPSVTQASLHAWLYALAIRINVACQKELKERTGAYTSLPQA